MEYIHSKHIAHCDLSLENVLVIPSTLTVCIIDFGLAVATDGMGHSEELFTRVGCGKANYLAPEVGCFSACEVGLSKLVNGGVGHGDAGVHP